MDAVWWTHEKTGQTSFLCFYNFSSVSSIKNRKIYILMSFFTFLLLLKLDFIVFCVYLKVLVLDEGFQIFNLMEEKVLS